MREQDYINARNLGTFIHIGMLLQDVKSSPETEKEIQLVTAIVDKWKQDLFSVMSCSDEKECIDG
jgi:hypothetical protein